MPVAKIYIHAVWSTKFRFPYLDSAELRGRLWEHIKQNAEMKGIHADTVNGYKDHCHCLILLGIDQNISMIMQLIKGESARWINKHSLCRGTFRWQKHYYAKPVSELQLDFVRSYIRNQEEHHRETTFSEEYAILVDNFGGQVFK